MKKANVFLLRFVVVQGFVLVLLASLMYFVFDASHFLSAMLAGVACWLPNVLFACALCLPQKRMMFGVGEVVKVLLSTLLLFLSALFYKQMVWWVFVVTVVVVLKSYWLVLLRLNKL